MAHPVTVLFFLAVFLAVVWGVGCEVWSTSTLGRVSIIIDVHFHQLTMC